jgi:hypothetical protein
MRQHIHTSTLCQGHGMAEGKNEGREREREGVLCAKNRCDDSGAEAAQVDEKVKHGKD